MADKFIRQNRQELCMKQASDVKLKDIRRRVESGLFRPKVVASYVGSAHKTIIACWRIYQRPIGE